jgi:DNA-binding winged helix-turn-helix (wHTH) protein/TolB-like protein
MPVIRFGLFEFDPAARTLSREGVPVRLQPQPARVLALLLERNGQLVTRDELRSAVWGDETFVDFERGLNFCIAQIRSALGDAADSPRYVETLPRRGYRFIAPTHVMDRGRAAPGLTVPRPVTADEAALEPAGAARRGGWVAAAVIAIVVLTAGGAAGRSARHQGSPAAPIRLAVVPFDNETGSTEYDRIAGGVADATVARLATPERLTRFAVVGNAAVLRRPRAFRDLEAIGEELGVEYVVVAQVKSDGTRVRLVAHLIRARDQAHVWANTFDRPAFTLDVQAELAEAIASAVTARVAAPGS